MVFAVGLNVPSRDIKSDGWNWNKTHITRQDSEGAKAYYRGILEIFNGLFIYAVLY